MRRFILFLVILLAAVWVGVKIAADPGYVLLAYHQWTVEMPLWFTIFALLFIFFALYFLVRVLRNIGILPRRLRNWSAQRQERIAVNLTKDGMLALAAGDWRIAEKKLVRADLNGELRWLNFIAAAQAADEQRATERRDSYLRRALKDTPQAEVAVGLARARFQFSQQQLEQALATLRRLAQLAPRQSYVAELLAKVYIELKEWENLLELLTRAQKQKILSTEKITALEKQAYQGLLSKTAQQSPHMQVLQDVWRRMPRNLQQDVDLQRVYAVCLREKGAAADAEELLRKSIAKHWDNNLVREYGLTIGAHPDKQLSVAEGWLKSHENNPVLLLTLGRLCVQNQLWGKARSYLETSLAQQPKAETYAVLAQLFEHLNDDRSAYENYRRGLLASANS